MTEIHVFWVLLYALGGILPLILLRPTLRKREKPGAKGLLLMIGGGSLWALAGASNALTTTPGLWWVTSNFIILGTSIAAIGWFLTTFEYTAMLKPTRKVVAVLALYPLLWQVIVWTNPLHHLFYEPFSSIATDKVIAASSNGLYLVHTLLGYLLVFVGCGLLLREILHTNWLRQRQGVVLLSGVLPPVFANVPILAGATESIRLGPISVVLSVFILAWGLFMTDFLRIVPVGRRTVLGKLDDAVVTVDGEGHVVDYNESAGELVGVNVGFVGMTVTEFFEPIRSDLDPYLEDREINTEVEVSIDGQQRYFLLSISSVENEIKKGRVFVLREITARKHRERKLKRQNERLDQFASMVSHDLRNPLNVASLRLEVISDDASDEHVEAIRQCLDRMERITDDLLRMSRAGTIIEDPEPVAISDVATAAWSTVQTGGATLDLCLSDTATVQADRDRLRHVFENLFRNAIEHNDPPLTLRVGPLDAEGATSTEMASTGFFIEDNGVGIPEDDRGQVLERGYTTSEKGTGLGLAIVRDIVEAHGWELNLTESPTGGVRLEIHTRTGT